MARAKSEEPWLKKRENGAFYVHWYDAERKHERRKSLDTSDHVTAVTRFAEFLVRGPDDPESRRGLPGLKPTVEQVLDWYEKGHVDDEQEGPVASDRQRYAIAPLRVFFKDKFIHQVDKDLSKAYREFRTGGKLRRPVTASTVRRELGVLIAAANYALGEKKIGHDDLPQIKLPTEAGADDKKPWLTKTAVRFIFANADPDLADFAKLAYYWGSRRAAVEGLRAAQVNLQQGTVDLHPPGARRTKKRKPIVPIYPEIRSVIERRMIAAEGVKDGWLFPARVKRADGNPFADFYVSFKTFCSDNQLVAIDGAPGEAPWPHLLRHSRASHMLMDGESIYKVAKLLGDTTATVEKVYGHHSAEFLATQSTAEIA